MCRSNIKSSESGEIINGECDVSTSVKGETSGNAKISAGLRRIPFNEACFFLFCFFTFSSTNFPLYNLEKYDSAYC